MRRIVIIILIFMFAANAFGADMRPVGIPLLTQVGNVDTDGIVKNWVLIWNGSEWVAAV